MEIVGVQLVADGADAYLADLTNATAAETKLGAAAVAAADGVNDLGGASKQAGKGTEDLGDKSEKGSHGLDGLKQAAIGAAREIGSKLVDAAQEAGQAVLQFIGDSIGKAGDFEQQMNRFASVTGSALADSGTSLEQFKDLFISLGRELPVSTAEVQQAAIEMAKGGIEPATIAAGGLRDVLNLAAAGEVGIAEAAEIASKQLGVWVDSAASAGEKAAFLTETSNLLAQAANASTVGVKDLALGLANTGKSADIAGLSFRETVTSMALISSGFSSAADAGTSFKTFLARLQPTTNSQADAFKQLNLLTAEGKSIFYDATGSFIGMDKAAGILKQSLEGMSDAQKESALNAAFGSDAIRAAAMLADAGAEGYARMAAEMGKAGSAAVQAAKKQQGFNVAVENAMGSVEALQITVASAALPALTSLVNAGAGAINMFTDFADATQQGETWLSALADGVNAYGIPALAGLTTATLIYAGVQASTMIPAITATIAKLALQTAAFLASAEAMLIAIAPYALMAAAVAGVVWAWQDFTSKVQDATTVLLESRTWWTDATAAIEDYGAQTKETQTALAPFANEISAIQTQLQNEVKSLGERDAAGLVSDEQRATEMAHINALSDALISATGRYTEQEAALQKATAASMTATSQSATMASAMPVLGESVSLTTKDIEDLGKQIQKTFTDGQTALSAYATNYSTFASGVETRGAEFSAKMAELETQKQAATTEAQRSAIAEQQTALETAYADQEGAAAKSYAEQQAAQKAHLGQMLIDYTVAQASLGNISKTRAAEITKALETEYGLQESSTATTFLNMAQSIDSFANDSGASVDELIGDLRKNQDQAKESQKAMDDYAKEYTATQVNNFLDGKSDVDEYTQALEDIPREVQTTLTINENRVVNEQHRMSEHEGKATGGTVNPMQTYVVGEQGQETFTPTTAGYITPHDALQRAMASGAQLSSAAGGSTTNNVTSSVTYQMPIYTNQSPAVLQQSLAIVEAMST